MKTFFYLLSSFFLITAFSEKAHAQVITAYVSDSTDQCPNPGNVFFFTNSNLSGFTVGDQINQTLYFGDGQSYSFPTYTVSNPSQYTNNPAITHNYTATGTYNAYMVVTGPGVSPYTTPPDPVVINGLVCGTASGTLYNDLNNNCIKDPGEQLAYHLVRVELGGNIIGTDNADVNGNYTVNFPYAPGNTYVVKKSFSYNLPCYGVLCPNTINYAVTAQNSVNLDFGVGPLNNNMYDLNTAIGVGPGQFNAGTNKSFKIYYGNMGCVAANSILTVTLDPSINFISSVPAPNSVSGNVLTYNLNSLVPQYYYNQHIAINSFIPMVNSNSVPFVIGDSVHLSSSIAGVGGTEFDPIDNFRQRWFVIGTAYDPNEKDVSPKGQGAAGNVGFGTEFTYDVHFQNTGNAPAQNVVVTDTLDTDLDENSVDVLFHSHHMLFTKTGNALRFEFPTIMLPDSLSDPKGSMGMLTFRVKHKTGLPNQTQIHNKASIYFDVNQPIVTNTTLNTLVSPSMLTSLDKAFEVAISPNPANDFVQIHSAGNDLSAVDFYTILGERVISRNLKGSDARIQLAGLSQGLYFVKLHDKQGRIVTSIISKQ